ncbi:MAG: hypothetical protein ACI9CE_002833 [Flavobacterium sp.]|jgi:hypothetical protein
MGLTGLRRFALLPITLAIALVFSACSMQNPAKRIKEAKKVEHSIGVVVQSSGYPKVSRKSRHYMLSNQSRIYRGDIIETDSDSRMKIEMNDGSTFILGHNTHFVIHYYKYESKALTARIGFTNGSLLTSTVKDTLAKKTQFEITTPLGVIGAQSAEFWSGFTFGDNRLDTVMISGTKIYIENDHGEMEITEHKTGTTVIGNSAPKNPETGSKRTLNEALLTIIF